MNHEFGKLIKAVCDGDINGTTKATSDVFDANYQTSENICEAHEEAKKDLQDVSQGLTEAGLPEYAEKLSSIVSNQMDININHGGYNARR